MGELAKGGREAARGKIGIFGEKGDEIAAGNVRMVDAGIGADETVMGFDDEHAVRADYAARFADDDFDETRIAREFFRKPHGLGRRADFGKTQDAAFRFRNNLLRDNEDVSFFKGDLRVAGGAY